MKNYWASDYALNKKSAGIVYRFADGVVEISLEDYLRENPGNTEADFRALKAISDEIYYQQVKAEHTETYRDIPLHTCKGVLVSSAEEILESQIAFQELERIKELVNRFLNDGPLTATQRRRFELYCYQGLSTRQIAYAEGVTQKAVWKSLHYCEKKIQKFLGNRVVTLLDFLH